MQSKKSFFDRTVFKKTITRFWPLWTGYFAIWLIALPLQGLTYLRLQANARPGLNDGYMENFANSVVPDMAQIALGIAVVFGVLCAMAVFSHLYNARSANLYGSLPVRREGLFLSHYLAGLCFFLVPNAAIFLLTLLVEAAGGWVAIKGLLFWLGVSCGEGFFFYSLAAFCAMFTGHILALPVFYAVINVLVMGLTGLAYTVMRNFYYGFAGFPDGVGEVVEWLTPIQCLSHKVESWYSSAPMYMEDGTIMASGERVLTVRGMGAVGVYALAGLALAACAFLLYRARHMESAGDVVAVEPMKPVFKYGVAFCVGLLFGVGTTLMLGLNGSDLGLMACILVWGVIGCFAAQMLLDKSFRVFHKWKGAVAVGGVFIALFLVVGLDLTGFEKRVPEAAEVESVFVQGLYAVELDDGGDEVWLDITDPGQIQLLTELHRAAVEQGEQDALSAACRSTQLQLSYTLNSGATLKRRYSVSIYPSEVNQEGSAANVLEKLYHNTDFYWRVYEFDQLEQAVAGGYRMDRAEFQHYDENEGMLTAVAGYGGDARTLLDAVEEDFKAGRIGVRTITEESIMGYKSGYEDIGIKDTLTFYAVDPANSMRWEQVTIALDKNAASTLAVLEQLAPKMDTGTYRSPLLEEAVQRWIG